MEMCREPGVANSFRRVVALLPFEKSSYSLSMSRDGRKIARDPMIVARHPFPAALFALSKSNDASFVGREVLALVHDDPFAPLWGRRMTENPLWMARSRARGAEFAPAPAAKGMASGLASRPSKVAIGQD